METPETPQTPTQDDPMLRLRYYRETGQADEAKNYERYLRDTGQYAESAPQHGASGSWGDEKPDLKGLADRSTFGNVSRAALSGMTLGTGLKLQAAGNAAIDRLHGEPFGDAYKQRLAAERSASEDFGHEHPVANIATELAGGLLPALVTGGASAPNELANVGRLARMGKAAKTGAGLGAASSAINADGGFADRAEAAAKGTVVGGVGGAVLSPVFEGAGYIAKKAHIPEMLSAGASKVAGALPSGNRWDALRSMLESTGDAFGSRGAASTEVAKRLEADANTPHTPPTSNAPAMALDNGGVNLEGLAKGIVRRPGAAGAQIRTALTDRQAQMRPQVNQAFDQATGTTLHEGEATLQRLAEEQTKTESAENVAKLVGQESTKPAAADPIAALTELTGADRTRPGSAGIRQLRSLVDAQSEEARRLYGAARAATEGQGIDSPTLQEVQQTPIGKLAFSWAKGQKLNRGGEVPTVLGAEKPPAGMSTEDFARMLERMKGRPDITPMDVQLGGGEHEPDVELPDPEMLHYAKQYLAKVARLGVNDGAQGKLATEAQGALGVWDKIRDELPDVWQHADAAFAKKARLIGMLNEGRGILRTLLNPPGQGKRALTTSLDAVAQRVAAASPDEQQAFRVGAQSAHLDHLRSGRPIGPIAQQLSDPTSLASRRLALAMGDEQAPQKYLAKLMPSPQQIPGAPPIPTPSPENAAAGRGLDVLRHGVSGSSNAPERTLSNLAMSAATMSPTERAALQQGAAHAVRGKFAGAARSMESPGRVFNASGERAEQVSHAFPSKDAEEGFQNLVGDWDAMAKRKQNILGGSDTQANLAEQEARAKGGSALSQLLHLHPIGAARALVGGVGNEAASAGRQQVDKAIADILTSIDPRALNNAQSSAQLRARLDALRASMAGVTAAQHSSTAPDRP